MPWWGWIATGAALLAAETLVDTQFYLVFFGAAALVTGLVAAFGVTSAPAVEWALFGALAVLGTALLRKRLYSAARRPGEGSVEIGTVGELAVAREPIAPGALGRAELRGVVWQAKNVGRIALEPGGLARVRSVSGIMLELEGDSP